MQKPKNLSTLLVVFLLLVAGVNLSVWLIKSQTAPDFASPARQSPEWDNAVARARNLLEQGSGTPLLRELILAKYQGEDELAAYLLHDTSGKIGQSLLEESRDELKAYQAYRSGPYLYKARVESNSLALYRDGACVATIPLRFVHEHGG